MKLVECVPNFSEGRDQATLDAIAAAIRAMSGVSLLDVDPGADTHRTVFTFVGSPDAAVEAAFQAIKIASQLIDMRQHTGAHPRMGATDVCPFVPLEGMTMEDCAALARRLGARVGEELGIPIYLYEHAASRPERQNLADIRAGEYEALPEKMTRPDFAPDFGPAEFNARAGVTAIGAREFLVAYNINLNTADVKKARKIAFPLREKGTARREKGRLVRDEQGEIIYDPGLFKHCKATGWYLPEHDITQVTMNLTNFREAPVHEVFDQAVALAEKIGVRVTGSEIVGLVPLEAMLAAGRHYLLKQKANPGIPEHQIIDMAIRSLGLSDLTPFDPDKKIIEHRVKRTGRLVDQTVEGFLDELSSDSPAPGGGSVAALSASLAAALTAMVAALTHDKKGFKDVRPEMAEVGERAQRLKAHFRDVVDLDTDAFNAVMDAFRLPKGTDDEAATRAAAILEANKGATRVPFELMRTVTEELPPLIEAVIARGNPNSLSDAGVAALHARAAVEGAYYNVLINLDGLGDEAFVSELRAQADALYAQAAPRFDVLASAARERLG